MSYSNGYPLYPTGSYNGYGYNMLDNGYGYSPYQYYQAYVYDQLWINSNLYRAQNVIYNIYGEKEKSFEARKLRKSGECYYITERNGREVRVGKMRLKDKLIVNQKPDGTFDALYCICECEGKNDPISISIPYKELVKRNILPYLPFFRRNEDCPEKYIVLAFFQELLEGEDIKFLQLPQHSGWQDSVENKTTFASSEIVIPQLVGYYSEDIIERKLIHTEKSLAEAAESLANLLPICWKYKFLLAIRITSLLLYFYGLAEFVTDQMFVVEPKSESNAKTAIALLKNKNCNLNSCSLTDNRTNLQRELDGINDGIALFRDSSYVEENKKRDAGLDVLFHDLHNCTGRESGSRHITVVLSDTPGNISSEFPAYFISLGDSPDIENIHELQQAIGELDSALIRHLSNSEVTDNLVTHGLRKKAFVWKTISTNEDLMSFRMILSTVEILLDYKIISSYERRMIVRYLKNGGHEMPDTDQGIVNDFRQVLSDCIICNKLAVVNQIGPPYFDQLKPMAFYDGKYINLMATALDKRILPLLKTTQRRNKLLSALKACGKLYSNNYFKRNLDVEISPRVTETISVYSFPVEILTTKCCEKINALAYSNYLFANSEFSNGFMPILYINSCNKAAGRIVDDSTDEAESMYISGQTRSGKTKFLVEQSIIRHKHGNKVIIFDQTGAFSRDELQKHLPNEKIEKYFTHWDIGKYGIPIDLMSLENCSTLPEKKNWLFSIFSVAASITGEVQGKTLKKRLSYISKAIDAGEIHSLPETLAFFDENDLEQSKIRDRLEEIFDDLEGLNTYEQNWGDFLNSQKIVVLSTSADGIRKGSRLIDLMLANLYEYKQHDRTPHYTVILDEIEDLCLDKDGPISAILRKGAKHRLSMLLASQEFSVDKDKIGKIIGNCGTLVFFHPKTENIADISKLTGVDKATLANLEQGHCVYHGLCYNGYEGKNKNVTLIGQTYKHHK